MKKIVARLLRSCGFRIVRFDKSKQEYPSLYEKNKNQDYNILKFSDKDHHIFFGYHDKKPTSFDNNKLLACSVPLKYTKSVHPEMYVGYYQKNEDGFFDKKLQIIGKTSTWCWQQGCMLQWTPANPSKEIIYNRLVEGMYGSVIYDVDRQKNVKEFKYPIYSLSPDGNWASSLNFSRLEKLRPGYGYKQHIATVDPKKIPLHDGVNLINLQTGTKKLIVDLNDLASYSNKENGHYINHITFSPDGTKLAFFHIYHHASEEKIINFYLYDLINDSLELLESTLKTSHYCWKNKDEILSTEMNGLFTNYYLYDLKSKEKQEIDLDRIGDLHPMFSPVEPSIFVGDSKPDGRRKQHIFLFDIDSGAHEYIDNFYSPKNFTGKYRCDLHPRWDTDGKYIIIDTAESGKRELAMIDVLDAVDRLKSN